MDHVECITIMGEAKVCLKCIMRSGRFDDSVTYVVYLEPSIQMIRVNGQKKFGMKRDIPAIGGYITASVC